MFCHLKVLKSYMYGNEQCISDDYTTEKSLVIKCLLSVPFVIIHTKLLKFQQQQHDEFLNILKNKLSLFYNC